jgi:hypothetical protein
MGSRGLPTYSIDYDRDKIGVRNKLMMLEGVVNRSKISDCFEDEIESHNNIVR